MTLFLLVYDRASGKLISLDSYDEEKRSDALLRRAQLEIEHREHAEVEVVVLTAASLDDLKKTHSRYFESLRSIISQTESAQ